MFYVEWFEEEITINNQIIVQINHEIFNNKITVFYQKPQ